MFNIIKDMADVRIAGLVNIKCLGVDGNSIFVVEINPRKNKRKNIIFIGINMMILFTA